MRLELGSDVDTPVGAQPDERLDGDDGTAPHDGPFLGSNVLVVEVLVGIKIEEDGPDDGKGPDVCVIPRGKRAQQLGGLDLGIVHEGRHGGRGFRLD